MPYHAHFYALLSIVLASRNFFATYYSCDETEFMRRKKRITKDSYEEEEKEEEKEEWERKRRVMNKRTSQRQQIERQRKEAKEQILCGSLIYIMPIELNQEGVRSLFFLFFLA